MNMIRPLTRRSISIAAALFACFLLGSCTDFKEAWKGEMEKSAKNKGKHTDLTGPWEGTWKSDVNGHNGKLRCIITKQKDGQYEFHYWAQWQKVLSGSYRGNYKVAEKNGSFTFKGEKDLGKLGGNYTHNGSANATTFKATYSSDMGDKGVFELKRPTVKAAAAAKKKDET